METNTPPTDTVYMIYDPGKDRLIMSAQRAPYISLTFARKAAQQYPRGTVEVWEYQLAPVKKLPVKPGRYEEV